MSQPNNATDLVQKYAVVAELGQGGMSIVHLAAARGLGNVQKLVVLKSMRPELISNEKARQMFMDEARLATRLTHPNIVQTYEVVMLGGRPVIVMEYMEGQSLSSVLRRAAGDGGLPLSMKLRILIEALVGLDHAHTIAD
jgi:serine/threonine protein kinase